MDFNPVSDKGQRSPDFDFGMSSTTKPIFLTPRSDEPDWEATFASRNPTTYKMGKTFFEWFVPFGWAVTPSGREQFKRMDTGSQIGSILLDTFFTALLTPWGRGVAKSIIKAPIKALSPKPKRIKPFEDAVLQGIKPFDYEKSFRSTLGKKGLKTAEIEAVLDDNLPNYLSRAVAEPGKLPKPITPSKGLQEVMEVRQGRTQISRAFHEKYSYSELKAQHYQKQYQGLVAKELGQKYNPTIMENIYKEHASKFGIDTTKIGIGEASPKIMSSLIDDIVSHPRTVRKMGDLGSRGVSFPLLNPTRVVFGYMEKPFGAFSKIYEPIVQAHKATFTAAFNHTAVWGKMLEQNGLAKVVATKGGKFKIKPGFSSEQSELAYKVIIQKDNIMGAARAMGKKESLLQASAQISKLTANLDEPTRKIVKTWEDFSNALYADHMRLKIPQILDKYRLTPAGKRGFDKILAEIDYDITATLSTASRLSSIDKRLGVENILAKLRQPLAHPMLEQGRHPWLKGQGKPLFKELENLNKDLSIGRGGTFVNFLENYVARIGQQGAARSRQWGSALSPNMKAFYTKSRRAPTAEFQIKDFGSMIEARVMAQAKELNLYPVIAKVVDHAKGMPQQLAEYTNHFISRTLNLPSVVDHKVAKFMERTVGGLEETLLGRSGTWDARRVQNLAMSLNNLTHLGGLGFKPFSAVRNLFQPLVTVPADLGGLRDIAHLGMGSARAMRPETRAYIKSIGAIQEYAPELYTKVRALPMARKALGVSLPQIDTVRDTGMWMFKMSDRWNRYVTGGAALNKWERALLKVPEVTQGKGIEKFVNASGIKGRHSWMREKITDMIRRGDLEGAKKAFTYDVIADTQFLYSSVESPLIAQKYGGLGKTGAIFQSWWMNYGALLGKWLGGGQAPGSKASRTITAITSMAIAEQLVEAGFGKSKAHKIAFAGPFPLEMNEFLIPPAWTPIYHSVGLLGQLANYPVTGDWEGIERKVKATIGSGWIFVPGGLQIKAMSRAVQEEGWQGLPAGILQFHQDPGFQFGGPLRELID